jgi:hypothetical protein
MKSGANARRSDWTVVAPVSRVELSSEVNYEFRINRVTFIARERLAKRRLRFGLPETLSALTSGKSGKFLKMMLEQSPTLAVVQMAGSKESGSKSSFDCSRTNWQSLAPRNLASANGRISRHRLSLIPEALTAGYSFGLGGRARPSVGLRRSAQRVSSS